jgi:hypothetical protein
MPPSQRVKLAKFAKLCCSSQNLIRRKSVQNSDWPVAPGVRLGSQSYSTRTGTDQPGALTVNWAGPGSGSVRIISDPQQSHGAGGLGLFPQGPAPAGRSRHRDAGGHHSEPQRPEWNQVPSGRTVPVLSAYRYDIYESARIPAVTVPDTKKT